MFSQIELTSCLSNPQAGLSEAFNAKNVDQFKIALQYNGNPDIIDESTNVSIFDRACQTAGSSEFIKICLNHGCSVDKENPVLQKAPLNFAAESKDSENLSVLLQHNAKVNTKFENLTAIHQLIKYISNEEELPNIFDCIKLLIKYNIDVNIPDKKGTVPILTLARKKVPGVQDIIEYILSKCNVDLDSFQDGAARSALKKFFPDLDLPPKRDPNEIRNIDFNLLKQWLNERKETEFVADLDCYMRNPNYNQDNKKNIFKEDDGDGTLLYNASKQGLLKAVKALVTYDENPNFKTNSKTFTPIGVACHYGNYEVLELLLKHPNILVVDQGDPLVSIVIKKMGDKSYAERCDYNKCFRTLLGDPRIDLNEIDEFKCTALHYAVRYKNERAIRELLERGAYIGTKNRFHELPISEINPNILEDYFDSCITTNEYHPGDSAFEIVFDYTSLVSSKVRYKDEGMGNDVSHILNQYAEEMMPIEYMTKTPELRRLVKHPLITSFLWLKWNRLGGIFYTNFALYTMFCVSLILYLVFCYDRTSNEALTCLLYTFSWIGVIYVLIRELLQLMMASFTYFKYFENYIEICLIISSILILCGTDFGNDSYRRMIAAITILLAAAEFSILVGSLPVMSISTHMVMLKTVSITFLKSLFLYSIIIVSFALCFYTLLGGVKVKNADDVDGVTETPNDDEEENFNKFIDPGTAIIKTIVMFTGEFDAASIKFENNQATYFVFILFVFFISIVLLNLLNGLAVNDTQAIKKEAELTGFIYRAQLLTRYEKIMLGRSDSQCSNMLFETWFFKFCARSFCLRVFPDLLPLYKLALMPNQQNTIYIFQPSTALLEVRTNNHNIIRSQNTPANKTELSSGICCCLCWNQCSRMDKKIVKHSQAVLEHKYEKDEMEQEKNELNQRMNNIEKSLAKILEKLSEKL